MKRADFQADTNQGVWAKSESLGRSAKAHFWKAHRRTPAYMGSRCDWQIWLQRIGSGRGETSQN
jgi:hypothetical protein